MLVIVVVIVIMVVVVVLMDFKVSFGYDWVDVNLMIPVIDDC